MGAPSKSVAAAHQRGGGGEWSSDSSLSKMERFQLRNSDVITFHSYDPPEETKRRIDSLRRYNRPIVCTEYMARAAREHLRFHFAAAEERTRRRL